MSPARRIISGLKLRREFIDATIRGKYLGV
jgi:hypothetical protein